MTELNYDDIHVTDDEGYFHQDGYTVNWKWVPDEIGPLTHLKDYDESIYGRFDWGRTDRDTDQRMRPDGFDGNAERLDRYRPGGCQGDYIGLWWQPPDPKNGAPARGTPEFLSLRRTILDILTYGYYSIQIDVSKSDPPCPCCGHVKVNHGYDALYGIEYTADDEYKRSVFGDVLSEALGQLED